MRYLCVHSHCYQPPRENPWLEAVELQDSAYPYHDWNERIMAECYAPNTAARMLGTDQRILKIVNNYAHTSYNFGPTLLSWMKDRAPEGYASILEADRLSAERFSGHGSALAQCYNHMIMPLANVADKYTQVYWGIKDFEHRFGRLPEGMWLPETAVDLETLDIMARLDIRFTILAPSQAKSVDGVDVDGGRIDPTRAYFVKLPSGRTMNLFFYDGPVSQAVAFEHLLDDGEKFANRLLSAFSDGRDWPQLVHIATDGETYGHHHHYGDMALAYALYHIESKGLARLTNYGEYLELHPPEHQVEIFENTAWSCVHGVGRWRANCGCNSGGYPDWNQEWRAPLRDALDWLRDAACPYFESESSRFLCDPWAARNDYIEIILDRSPSSRAAFKKKHFLRHLNPPEQVRVWKLLEMQRHAMLMYTSCGWFFDELSGLETVQVIQYAARVLQIAHELFVDHFEDGFLEKLALAKSNVPEHRDGAEVYEKFVVPSMVNLYKVGAHYAISSLFQHYDDHARIYSYSVDREQYRTLEAGKMRIAIGKARFTSEVTQKWELLTFGVLHFGEHNVHAGLRPFIGEKSFDELLNETAAAFSHADLPEAVRVMDRAFGAETYSLKDLFRDEQRNAVQEILKSTLREAESAYRQLYGNHAPLLRFLLSCNIPLPREMRTTAEYAINSLLRSCLATEDLDLDRINNLLEEARIAGVKLDTTTLEFTLRRTIEGLSDQFMAAPRDPALLRKFEQAVDRAQQLPFPLVLWSIQNKCYEILQGDFPEMLNEAAGGDEAANTWIEHFRRLADLLSLHVSP